MEPFQPPKYLGDLITAANDGAKSAQTSALAFSLVGVYLLATAISTTDEDLLFDHTLSVSQIGVQVPVAFSFAIAPAVFVFLHAYTLIRYDMLAANLRQFRTDLQILVPREADRERCRQLLANVEFVQVRTAPRRSALHSPIYRFAAWVVLVGFPVATFGAVQVSALRYQSDMVLRTQQFCIALDLLLLAWFFYRQCQRGDPYRNKSRWVRYSLVLLLAVVVVVISERLYLQIPSQDDEQHVRSDHPVWREVYRQPLDLALCPALHWGCRYLTVDHRPLIGRVWRPEAIVDLRVGEGDIKKSLSGIEGVFLRGRSLRFAKLDESQLYAADLQGADLSHATLRFAQLQGAKMNGATLSGANLSGADLTLVGLAVANLNGSILAGANLSKANLYRASLVGAYLRGDWSVTGPMLAHPLSQSGVVMGANLSGAVLIGADVSEANFVHVKVNAETNLNAVNIEKAIGFPKAFSPAVPK
jgi:hypothetical protein